MHIQPSYPQHTNQTPSPAVQEWYQTRSQKGLYALFKIRLGLWLQEAHLTATYRNINFREAGPTGCPCFYFAVFSLSLLFSCSFSSCITLPLFFSQLFPGLSLSSRLFCIVPLKFALRSKSCPPRSSWGETCGQNIIKSLLDWYRGKI